MHSLLGNLSFRIKKTSTEWQQN